MTNSEFTKTDQSKNRDSSLAYRPFRMFSALQTIGTAAVIIATLLTLWTPSNLLSGELFDAMLIAIQATNQPEAESSSSIIGSMNSQTRIGIVAGHWNDTDNPGFVCTDDRDISEQRLNLRIATLVSQKLTALGYQTDLFQEHDAALTVFQANALISIHNDTCDFLTDEASGFKVAPALGNSQTDQANLLTSCIVDRYTAVTGLQYHPGVLTEHMTTYHTFEEIHGSTPVIVIETGYLNLDREILSTESDRIAQGIVESILCYLGEPIINATPEATRIP